MTEPSVSELLAELEAMRTPVPWMDLADHLRPLAAALEEAHPEWSYAAKNCSICARLDALREDLEQALREAR